MNSGNLLFIIVIAVSFSAGCTNNRLTTSKGSASGGNPLDSVINDLNTSQIVLTRVIKNAQNPTSTFDLLGDGTGAMGQKCISTGTGGSASTNQGASTCNCQYTYTRSDGAVESFEAPTTYHESNLIRCLFTGIPATISTVKVRIHLTTSDSHSNEITFKFNGSGVTLDPASELTFSKVLRYQCKQSIKVPYVFEPSAGKIYDPFQSEDPRNTYPLNYYTTNIGASYAYHAGGLSGITPAYDYHCPGVPISTEVAPVDPNDPNDPKVTLNVFSADADSAGSKRIYPPTGSAFDRSTFYLARQATSIFNIPVNSYVSPGIFSVAPDADGNTNGLPPSLGYGASPIPTGIQGQETCPETAIQIPQGYRWVKVWLFRMALPTRKFLSSVALQQLNTIWCSPGDWTQGIPSLPVIGEPTRSVFDACHKFIRDGDANPNNNPQSGATYLSDIGTVAGVQLASRFFQGTAMCVNLDTQRSTDLGLTPIPGPGRTSNAGSLATSTLAAPYNNFNFPLGTDIWRENDLGATARDGASPLNFSCRGPNKIDPTHLCGAPVGTNNPGSVPYDDNLITGNIDDPSTPRFDYLFVVTPPTVMSGDMASISSPTHFMYTPYRFMSATDCNVADPDAGACPADRALRNYGIKFHDVGGAGDPPADDPNRPGVFPVCALQKS